MTTRISTGAFTQLRQNQRIALTNNGTINWYSLVKFMAHAGPDLLALWLSLGAFCWPVAPLATRSLGSVA